MLKLIKQYLLKKSRLLRALKWLSYNIYDEHNKDQFRELGENCIIHNNCIISHKNRLLIKNNVQIHNGVILNCQGGLYIGNNVGIANGCTIWTVEHIYQDSRAIPYGPNMSAKPVYIDDNVWIGANARILPGIEIGEGAIVGMGSVVTKDVPPCSIVLGFPARVIGYRNKDEYEKCKAEKKYVTHQYFEKIIVPKYTQNRPKLFDIVKPFINNKEMIIEEE